MTTPITDQARAIRQQSEKRPAVPKESPREARYRVQKERDAERAKSEPHKQY